MHDAVLVPVGKGPGRELELVRVLRHVAAGLEGGSRRGDRAVGGLRLRSAVRSGKRHVDGRAGLERARRTIAGRIRDGELGGGGDGHGLARSLFAQGVARNGDDSDDAGRCDGSAGINGARRGERFRQGKRDRPVGRFDGQGLAGLRMAQGACHVDSVGGGAQVHGR